METVATRAKPTALPGHPRAADSIFRGSTGPRQKHLAAPRAYLCTSRIQSFLAGTRALPELLFPGRPTKVYARRLIAIDDHKDRSARQCPAPERFQRLFGQIHQTRPGFDFERNRGRDSKELAGIGAA